MAKVSVPISATNSKPALSIASQHSTRMPQDLSIWHSELSAASPPSAMRSPPIRASEVPSSSFLTMSPVSAGNSLGGSSPFAAHRGHPRVSSHEQA